MVSTLVRLAEAEGATEHHLVPAWAYGVGTFAVLVLLLFVVTRFSPER